MQNNVSVEIIYLAVLIFGLERKGSGGHGRGAVRWRSGGGHGRGGSRGRGVAVAAGMVVARAVARAVT
jgi:hypothetical protein